jgi:hypothetical protein
MLTWQIASNRGRGRDVGAAPCPPCGPPPVTIGWLRAGLIPTNQQAQVAKKEGRSIAGVRCPLEQKDHGWARGAKWSPQLKPHGCVFGQVLLCVRKPLFSEPETKCRRNDSTAKPEAA